MSWKTTSQRKLVQVAQLLQEFMAQKQLNAMLSYWLKLKYFSIQPSSSIIHRSEYLRMGQDGKIIINQPKYQNIHNIYDSTFQNQYSNDSVIYHSHSHPTQRKQTNYPTFAKASDYLNISDHQFQDLVLSRLTELEQSMSRVKLNKRQGSNIYSKGSQLSQPRYPYQDQTISRIQSRAESRIPSRNNLNKDSHVSFVEDLNRIPPHERVMDSRATDSRADSRVIDSRYLEGKRGKIYTQMNQNHLQNYDNEIVQNKSYHTKKSYYGEFNRNQYGTKTVKMNENPLKSQSSVRKIQEGKKIHKVQTKDWKPRFFKKNSVHLKALQSQYSFKNTNYFTTRLNENQDRSNKVYSPIHFPISSLQQNYNKQQDQINQRMVQSKEMKYYTYSTQPLNYSFNPKGNIYSSKASSPLYNDEVQFSNIPVSHLEENVNFQVHARQGNKNGDMGRRRKMLGRVNYAEQRKTK